MTKEKIDLNTFLVGVENAGQAASQISHPTSVGKTFKRTDSWPIKIFDFGVSGSGKTMTLLGPLLAGERLWVLSSDVGGQGLATVVNTLHAMGKDDLYENNLTSIEASDYMEIVRILRHPDEVKVDGAGPTFDQATVAIWDGYSGFQLLLVDDYLIPVENASTYQDEDNKFAHWRKVKKASIFPLNLFLMSAANKHRIVTALEPTEDGGQSRDGKPSRTRKGSPLVQGAAQDLLHPAFDIIINTFHDDVDTLTQGREIYKWRCQLGGSVQAKNRNFNLPGPEFEVRPEELGDLWKRIVEKS